MEIGGRTQTASDDSSSYARQEFYLSDVLCTAQGADEPNIIYVDMKGIYPERKTGNAWGSESPHKGQQRIRAIGLGEHVGDWLVRRGQK